MKQNRQDKNTTGARPASRMDVCCVFMLYRSKLYKNQGDSGMAVYTVDAALTASDPANNQFKTVQEAIDAARGALISIVI